MQAPKNPYQLIRDRLRCRWGDYSPSARACLFPFLDQLEAAGVRSFDRVTEVPIPGGDRRVTILWLDGPQWLAMSFDLAGHDLAGRYRFSTGEEGLLRGIVDVGALVHRWTQRDRQPWA